jgi:SAM-dependent methyltransferase
LPLEGYIDLYTDEFIAGWIWDRDDPQRHIDVEILLDGRAVERVTARQYREDLQKNDIGDGNHAFWYTFPAPISRARHSISVRAVGAIDLPFSGTGSAVYITRPLDWPAIRVETGAEPAELNALYERVSAVWSHLGRVEPYWSVLTAPEFKAEAFSQYELFYSSGKGTIEEFAASVSRAGLSISPHHTCFELGCGVGRLTSWLAPRFKHVIAADISREHLDIAATALRAQNIANVSLRHLTHVRDLLDIGSFDVFFSVIVLQHNPPPVIVYMLKQIFAGLSPGGIAYFQLPTYEKMYSFSVRAYLSAAKDDQSMEMHVVPQNVVVDLIYQSGCRLLEVREDSYTGSPTGISNTFLVQKLAG